MFTRDNEFSCLLLNWRARCTPLKFSSGNSRLSGELIKLQLLFQDHCQKQRSTFARDSLNDLKVIDLKDGHECSFFLNYHVNFNGEAFFS